MDTLDIKLEKIKNPVLLMVKQRNLNAVKKFFTNKNSSYTANTIVSILNIAIDNQDKAILDYLKKNIDAIVYPLISTEQEIANHTQQIKSNLLSFQDVVFVPLMMKGENNFCQKMSSILIFAKNQGEQSFSHYVSNRYFCGKAQITDEFGKYLKSFIGEHVPYDKERILLKATNENLKILLEQNQWDKKDVLFKIEYDGIKIFDSANKKRLEFFFNIPSKEADIVRERMKADAKKYIFGNDKKKFHQYFNNLLKEVKQINALQKIATVTETFKKPKL